MQLSAKLRKITPPGSSVECFCDPLFAHQYSFYHKIDALFATAQMCRLSGIELAENMRTRHPDLRIFILWSDDAFRRDAEKLGADAYLITPITADSLKKAMDDAESQNFWAD